MTHSNLTNQIPHRRHAFRLALCIAMAANASLALADSELDAKPQQVSNCELPKYPFPTAPDVKAGSQATHQRAIVRLLGFTGNNEIGSKAASLPPIAPPSSVAIADYNFHSLPGLPIQAPCLPQADLQVAHSGDSQQPTLSVDASVVVANATRPAQAVHESISDKVEPTDGSLEAPDLLYSLDDLMSPVCKTTQAPATACKDSIQIVYPSEPKESSAESGISINMSDRSQPPTAATSRAPELVNTKQSMVLRTASPKPSTDEGPKKSESVAKRSNPEQELLPVARLPNLERLPQQLQPSDGPAALPMLISKPSSALAPAEDESHQGLSSRRESKPEPMKIRIEGEPIPTFSQPRQPLVPMLASASGRAKMPERVPFPQTSQPQLEQQTQQASMPTANPPSSTHSGSKVVSVMVKDSVSLQSAEAIQALSVEHEDICQVIQTSGKSCSLVGLRPGETRVAVITESAGQRNVKIHTVKVGAAQTAVKNSNSIASDLSQTIQQIYPRSKVRIIRRGTQLVVSGSVESEETAKEILSLVRKTTLTPVVDELQTR